MGLDEGDINLNSRSHMRIQVRDLKTYVRTQKPLCKNGWQGWVHYEAEVGVRSDAVKRKRGCCCCLFGRLMRDIMGLGFEGGSQVVRPAAAPVAVFIHDGNDITSIPLSFLFFSWDVMSENQRWIWILWNLSDSRRIVIVIICWHFLFSPPPTRPIYPRIV